MESGVARHYDSAAAWLAYARAGYESADMLPSWQTYLQDLLAKHARKYKLVPLLRALK